MRELTELKRAGGLVDALLADHGLFHLEADLRWIDLTAARLDALAQGGAAMTRADRGARRRAVVRRRPRRCAAPASPSTAGEILAVMGPERLGQVDAAALPGRHPRARRRARSGSTGAGSTR